MIPFGYVGKNAGKYFDPSTAKLLHEHTFAARDEFLFMETDISRYYKKGDRFFIVYEKHGRGCVARNSKPYCHEIAFALMVDALNNLGFSKSEIEAKLECTIEVV